MSEFHIPSETKTPAEEANEAFVQAGRIVKDGQPVMNEEQVDPTQKDYRELYAQSQQENERLNALIAAGRLAPQTDHPNKNAKPGTTAEKLRTTLGPVRWLHATRTEKLVGLGLNPSEVDDQFLTRCFGRGNDGKSAKELMNSNPLRYRQLREASIALGIYAA